jgi:hypothetical protein
MKQIKNFLHSLSLIGNILLLFIASLAPLMFLVGVIASVDAMDTHTRLMDALAQGVNTNATVTIVDREDRYIGYRLTQVNGEEVHLGMISRIYPDSVWDNISPGDVIPIRYLGEQVPGYYHTGAPLDVYEVWRAHWGIPTDVLWMMFLAFLVVAAKPQFVFIGLMSWDDLFQSSEPK